MNIAIIGGGIGGLALALALEQRGLRAQVFEAAPELAEVGVGITVLPHAMRELQALGVHEEVEALGIENYESVFFNRWGQRIFSELRGRHAGYGLPEVGIHRGKLHGVLYRAACMRLGKERVHLGYRFESLQEHPRGVLLGFTTPEGPEHFDADIVIACDGVNSAVRRVFYPQEKLAFAGINTWRGVTRHKPILTGKSYMRIGSIETGKMVIYPIIDALNPQGEQLINWVAEIQRPGDAMNDWNRAGRPEDFIDIFKDWRFDWLDVPALIRGAESIFEYPMVDKDPVPQWTFGAVTLLGDAAHPMYPRGSNGSAQALIDARVLAEHLSAPDAAAKPALALQRYEALRRPATAQVVQTNRTVPPDYIIMKVDALTQGQPFGSIDEVISQAELQAISDHYKAIAGFSAPAASSRVT